MPWQSSLKIPSKRADPSGDQHRGTQSPEQVRTRRPPDAEREADDEKTGQIRGDLVVKPGAARCQCTEVGNIVVPRAKPIGLCNAAGDPAHVERDKGENAAGPPTND